jgi:anti-sigma regulatory factor (Ser/Thr protein kinase)
MTLTVSASPECLAIVRRRLREWLTQARVDPESGADVLLAVGEASANAAEHAVVGATRPVTLAVTAAMSGNRLLLTVTDDGRWRPATEPHGHRGHGMNLINALVDSVELTATDGGTTVQMLKELP